MRFHHEFYAIRYYFPAWEGILHTIMTHCYAIANPIVLNSNGTPPAMRIPAFTASESLSDEYVRV